MKKTKRFLAILALLVTTLSSGALAACNVIGGTGVSTGIPTGVELTALTVPTGLRINDDKLEWNPVEYADQYTVSVDGNEYFVRDTAYSLTGIPNGEHTFRVKANGDGTTYKSSDFSLEYTVTLSDGKKAETGYYSQFDDLTKQESFLGYGFDVINSSMFYDKVVKTSFPIFNHEDLMNQRLLKVDSKSSKVEEVQSSDMEEFMQQWNVAANVDVSWGGKRIGGSVSVAAQYSGGSESARSKYYHAVSIVNQKYYIVMQSDMSTYRQILSDGFTTDLYSDMEPAELFRKYGTHFITSAVMGGRINSYYLYTSEKEASFHDVSAAVSTEVRYLAGKTDVSVEGGYRQLAQSQSINVRNGLEVLGGSDFGMLFDTDIRANYLDWEKSLDNHASLMGIKDTGSLCPIWDLIDASRDSEERYTWTDEQGQVRTGTRAEQLQGYFLKYGVDNYNELMESAGLPKIVEPESISAVKVNGLNKNEETGEYEAYAGTNNPITFTVLPDTATGYTKTASLTSPSEYARISNENGLDLQVDATAPHNTVLTIAVAAGNVRETITVRIVRRYNVTFALNGGTATHDPVLYRNLLAGSQIPEPEEPTKEGYDFKGWYTDPNFDEATLYKFGEQAIQDNLTLYAKWTRSDPLIRFVHNAEGCALTQVKVAYNSVYAQPNTPICEGHDLVGYYSDEDMTVPHDFTLPVKSNIVIYVKWEKKTFPINFVHNANGCALTQTTAQYDTVYMEPPTPTCEGHTLVGYYSDEDMTVPYDFTAKIKGETTIYVKWEKIDLKISFVHNVAGCSFTETTVKYDTVYAEPSALVCEGYNLVGYYADENMTTAHDFTASVKKATTIYVKWEKKILEISFVHNAEGCDLTHAAVEYGNVYAEPATPTCAGYVLVGYYSDEDMTEPYDFTAAVKENKVVYVKWAEYVFQVSFHTNGGTEVPSLRVAGGECVEAPETKNKGYVLVGWYKDEACTLPFDFATEPITENVELYAKWEIGSFTVEFDENKPTGSVEVEGNTSSKTYLFGTDEKLPKNGYTLDGWIFKGWATESDGNVVFADEANAKAVSDEMEEVTLFAVWEVDPYSIGAYVDCGVKIADTNGKNTYIVYNDIAKTPKITCGASVKAIVDWRATDRNANAEHDYVTAVYSEGTRFGGGNAFLEIKSGTKEVYFIGDKSVTYSHVFISLSRCAQNEEIKLHFKDFNIRGNIRSYLPPETFSVYLDYQGTNTITAYTTVDIETSVAIKGCISGLDKVIIQGSGTVKYTSYNGANATTAGGAGSAGGVGIEVNALTVAGTVQVTVKGGNGGNGGAGTNATEGANGGNGGNGGAGGNAITVNSLTVNVSGVGKLSATGGNGGNGGKGGNGANGRDEYVASTHNSRDYYGEDGYDGGNGGNGGKYGLGVSTSETIVGTVTNTKGTYGKGGNGGNGGNGGHGSSYVGVYDIWWMTIWKIQGGSGGNGGNGGNGSTAGSGGVGGSDGAYGDGTDDTDLVEYWTDIEGTEHKGEAPALGKGANGSKGSVLTA